MGVLADAIREHLELKLRHGADPAEIARLEREALEPVQIEPLGYDDDPYDEFGVVAEHPPVEDEPDEHDDRAVQRGDDPRPHGDPLGDDAERLTPRTTDAPPVQADDLLGQETVEYALDEFPSRPRAGVLEQAPHFLADAPDHDRLWFEQRPPRDFDFDG